MYTYNQCYMGVKGKNVGAFLVNFIKTHAPKVIIVNYINFSLRRNDLNPELKLMLNHFRRSKLYQKVSRMWLHLMYIHIKRLVDAKSLTDITKNYCIRINDLNQFRYFHGSELETITDKNLICTVYMHNYVKKHFGKQSLEKAIVSEGSLVEFPQLIDGYFYSQDSLQSVCEIEWIKKKVSMTESRILEFGAGYGRLAKILFSAGVGALQYLVVDIPPALFISQSYLTATAQNKTVFKFRPFKDFNKVQKEFNEAQIAFITPDQLNYLPESMFDIAIGINFFQEIILEQIKDYFEEVDRLAKYLYLKAMDLPQNYYEETLIPLALYPIPQHWKLIDSQLTPFAKTYSEALYKTGS